MSEDPYYPWERKGKFLLSIAQEVDKLIHENPSNLDHFRRQVGVFVSGYEVCFGLRQPSAQDVSAHLPYLLAPVIDGGWPKEWPKAQKREDLLPDYYFLLTLIHDNLLPPPKFVPINNNIYNADNQWVEACWGYYRSRVADAEKVFTETATCPSRTGTP